MLNGNILCAICFILEYDDSGDPNNIKISNGTYLLAKNLQFVTGLLHKSKKPINISLAIGIATFEAAIL